MRFLFVNLDWPALVSKKTHKVHLALPPLDLLLMTNAARERGHQAKLIDLFVEDPSPLAGEAQSADWIIVATTPYHMWQCPNSEWEWICAALDKFPKEKLILSGLHATVFPEKSLRETGAFALILREPEAVFNHFLESLNWREVPGTALFDADQLRINPPPKLPHLDQLVVQDYDIDINRYGYFLLGKRTGIFESSRGCPWKCTFCDQEMYSWKYRCKSAPAFVEEVRRGVERTGMRTAYFYDLEFTIKTKRTVEICEGLIAGGVNDKLAWCCQTRADCIDETMLDAMKAAGCRLIHFGVESANPAVLEATNKEITLGTIERGVRLAKSKGLQTACFFMFGLPGETPDQFANTLEFARSLNPTYASFHFAIPFPGTPLYQRYIDEKQLEFGVWPATYFDAWPHRDISAYLSKAYRSFYLTPRRWEMREFAHRLSNFPQKLSYFLEAA